MEQATSTELPLLGVGRQFEANRLAKDFQARAYEQLLPVGRRWMAKAAEMEPVRVDREQGTAILQGGVAA